MPVSMNPSKPPPFHELDAMAFQELCRDLFEREAGISTCEIFGVNGQAQYGVDLKARRKDDGSCEVGQCKCKVNFPPGEIKKASDEFLKHLPYWKKRNVRKFILFVASTLDTTQQHEEIDGQVEAFAAHGIEYEPWSSRTLRTKLKDHRDIVLRYTRSKEWVEAICGPTIDSSPGAAVSTTHPPGLVESVLSSQLAIYSTVFSQRVAKDLDDIRELYRGGGRKRAYDQLQAIEEDPSWAVLESALRAGVWRAKAAYRLDMFRDIDGARDLADRAASLDPGGDETVIRALLKYYTEGPEAALPVADAPSSTSALNIQIAMLLEAGRYADALEQARRPPQGIPFDAETRRLRAMALLAGGDIDGARAEIERATEMAPAWQSVRFTAATIDYLSCLPENSLPRRLIYWPEPVNWAVIKRDDVTLERLKSAERSFGTLARETERGDEARRVIETWRLACMANDINRQGEASAFCRELLERDPAHYRALLWAQMRNLEVDLEAAARALEGAVRADGVMHAAHRAEAFSTLLLLHLRGGKTARARELLEEQEQVFADVGEQRKVRFWRGQILVAEGRSDQAVEEARRERDPDLRRSLMLAALQDQAERSGDWREFTRYLDRSFRKTKKADYLFELCALNAERGNWDYVAERAEELVETVNTAASVRLAANALWRKRRVSRCLKLLNRGERHFPGRALPGDLRRLKVDCQISKGELPTAVTEAKELFRVEQTTANVLTLMEAQLRQADLKELAVTARELIRRRDVPPQSLLRAAGWVQFEDVELARALWRRAAQSAADDPNLLEETLSAGFLLGLDKEVGPLFKRALDFSAKGEGSLKSISLEEFISQRQERAKYLEGLQQDYDRGAFPLHILFKPFERTLVDLLHGLPERQRAAPDPLRHVRLFIRHGGRPLHKEAVKSSRVWRLHADVSALIVAADLGVLDLVEETFNPIWISPQTTAALVMQRRMLQHRQPAQIEECKSIIRHLEDGDMQLMADGPGEAAAPSPEAERLTAMMGAKWTDALVRARAEGAFLVDHMPLASKTLPIKPVSLPPPYNASVIGCGAVVEGLRESGRISDEAYERARTEFLADGEAGSPKPHLPRGSKLFLFGSVISSLARAGVLPALCGHYQVFVDPFHERHARGVIRAGEYAGELEGWLGRLSDRVREGLTTGVYKCVEIADEHLANADERAEDPEATTVMDLLVRDPQNGDVLWVDDRHMNSYARSGEAPIVGVNEVLAALRERGRLTKKKYYEALQRLRAGNFRYVPPSAREITYYLDKARIKEGDVVESADLRTLRRYVAACLLDTDALQIPPLPVGSPNMTGEIAFVLNVKSAVEEAIIRLWTDKKSSVAAIEARADWLLKNLYTGTFGVRHLLPRAAARGDATDLLGIDIGGLLAIGSVTLLDLPAKRGKPGKGHRRRYIDWLEENLLLSRLKADPEAARVAADTVATFISDAASRNYETDAERSLSRLSKNLLFTDLPLEIKREVNLAPEVMEWIGTKSFEAVTVGPYDFRRVEFSEAIAKVMEGAPRAELLALAPDTACALRRAPDDADGRAVVEVIDPGKGAGQPALRIRDDFLRLASPDAAEREAVLRQHRFWFDCDRQTFESAISEINGIEDAAARLDRAQDWRKESAELYYRELESNLGKADELRFWSELIPPSGEGLLRHYRLPGRAAGGADFTAVYEESAAALLAEEGLEAALDRLACVPLRIPDCVVNAARELPREERDRLIERCSARWASPAGKLHAADLAIRAHAGEAGVPLAASAAVSDLYSDEWAIHFRAFEALLDFVSEEFAFWKQADGWAAPVRLALTWAHASRLHHLYHRAGADMVKLARIFGLRTQGQSAADVLHLQFPLWNDVLHRRRLDRVVFLTHGVASVLGAHGAEAVESLGLKQRVHETAFSEEARANVLPLLRDYRLLDNSTGSYLGGDHAEALAPIGGGEKIEVFSSASLQGMVKQAVEKLRDDPAGREWGTIEAVVGDLPIYAEASSDLKSLVESTDFTVVHEADPTSAILALLVAVKQAVHWDDSALRARLEDDLIRLLVLQPAEETGKEEQSEGLPVMSVKGRVAGLLDAALMLARGMGSPQAASEYFGRLLRRMLDAWPHLGDYFGSGFTRLLLQLPAAQLHGLWDFQLALRAHKDEAL